MADSDKVILLKIELDKAQASANIEKLKNSLKELDGRKREARVVSRKLRLEEAKLANLRLRSSKSIDTQAKSIQKLTKVQREGKTAVGASTSATLELGRVLSDMPYGIRGVANNLQQLASNLFFMSKATDAATGKSIGFGGAIGTLIKGLAGPAGILIAFQGIVALLDYFKVGMGKAKEETENTTSVLEKQREELSKLTEGYEDYLKIRQEVIQVTTKEREMMKALTFESMDRENSDERRNRALSKLIELYPKYFDGLKIDNIKGIFDAEEKVNRVLQSKLKLKQALERAEEISNAIQIEKIKIAKDIKNADLTKIGQLREEQKSVRELIQVYAGLDLELKKDKGGKREKATAFDTSQISKDAKNYVDEVMKMEKKNALLLATNNVDKLIIERDFQFKRLALLKGDNSALISEYTKYYDTLIKTAQEKLLGEGKIDPKKPATTGDAKEEYTLEDGLNQYMQLQSSMTSFLGGEYDRQLTIEQNKTNALNNELNQRLLNENLSKDERERIQLQIGQNDEKLRKKQEAIEKKRFKLNKAANMAGALINTYLSATKAYASQLIVGDPSSIIRAKIAAGVSIASGLLSVAAIARTKFQSSAGSGGSIGPAGGGAGGEGESREFNFNLAGSTQSNQLTQSIAGQLNQPIQTYVVSSEITSQQQLDLSISNTASLG